MFFNFYNNLKTLSLEKNLIVYITDFSLQDVLDKKNISFKYINYQNIDSNVSNSYGSKSWNKINLIKGTIFVDILIKNKEFIYSDPDVLWLKPIFFKLRQDCKSDICFQSDSKSNVDNYENINAGFFYAKKTNFTLNFFLDLKKRCKAGNIEKEDDQKIINNMIKIKNLRKFIQLLSRDTFANGKYKNFFGNCKKQSFKKLFTLHNNYVIGKKKKEFRAKKCGLWFNDDFAKI